MADNSISGHEPARNGAHHSTPKINDRWGVHRAALVACYAAWKAGKSVAYLYRGELVMASSNSLVAQVEADLKARLGVCQ